MSPLSLVEAFAFIDRYHRHHRAPAGGFFAIGLADAEQGCVIGAAVVGRPIARHLDNGWTAEVTRLCIGPQGAGLKGAASKLYAACWRAARAMGYQRLLTYTLQSESGASLWGAGWRLIGLTEDARGWNRPGRPRVDTHPLEQKRIWEVTA